MAPQKSISPRAWAEITLLAMIWGASFLAIRVALNEIGPLSVVAHRTFWAMLLLWGVVLVTRTAMPRDPETWAALAVMGLLNNAIPFTLMAWGQQYIETGLTSILNAATAIFGVVAAAIFLADERLTLRKGAGVGLGFAGVVTVIGLANLADLNLRSTAQLAVLAGTVSYALAGVWARRRLSGLSPLAASTGMLTCSAALSVPLAWGLEGPLSLSLAPATLTAIAYYALIATAGAYMLYYRVLAMAGSGNLLLVTLLIAPFAILLGALVLGETLHPRAYAGFALLGAGLAVLDGRILGRRRSAAIDRVPPRG
ncbi:DMT family transporter [Sulfitobacter sp. D35]|uniref:DMT family transporter n=1 Tax=Sulfitobacter sp. D35 TaxID=3083252 RepID=UPI00296F5BDE|nr:DMT family transporter [Sulfitobacter sp. D35]MDW4497767.1 DMT family transporter [Sulfitobacter sp. D35]